MIIRELVPDDYDGLIELWEKANLPFKPNGRDRHKQITEELAGTKSIFLIAEREGAIIGSILGTHDGRKGWINRLAVAPEYRRTGIASALVAAVEKRLAKLGIEIVACLVEDWNSGSQAFFERLGYHLHTDIHYYSKRRHPEV
ncbi:MAG: GNAT family N-acetyltransferase [Candidatus Bipolaricaulota bacterium]|nr:GNAT family N-acetyltransferase [Candidatus Bipolaricaulota bacterium]